MNREQTIVRTSLLGIIGNIFLVIGKAIIGFIAGSVAIITDALNNLTDALSSAITIIGTKISGRKPDKKHPYGHGRVEYLTSLIIAVLILIAGASAIYESINSLINTTKAEYDYVSLIVIALAIVVKIFLGLFFQRTGQKVKSEPLKASGKDALFDALLSVATLIGIGTSLLWDFNIEGYIGILIGLFILKSGIKIMRDGVSLIIGQRADQDLVNDIKKIVCSFKEVQGAYDLIVNNYGQTSSIASVHIEVSDDLTARDIHHLSREIALKVYQETNSIITVGIYAQNEANPEIKEIKKFVLDLVQKEKNIQQIHGFYVDEDKELITFDLVISFDCKDPKALIESVHDAVQKRYPHYNYYIIQDTDFAD